MAKKEKKYTKSIKDALSEFDLNKFKKWAKKNYSPAFFRSFCSASEEVQMATMCKCICNRTDMLGTEAHIKAVNWLKEHNMKGRIF